MPAGSGGAQSDAHGHKVARWHEKLGHRGHGLAAVPESVRCYRYVPVLVAVSIARPDSWLLPVTSVRM
jgi:hypothetical protein